MFGVTKAPAIQAARVWEAQLNDHAIAAAIGGPVALFDAPSGHRLATLPGHNIGTTSLSWRFDSGAIATGGQDGTVRIWGPATAALRHSLDAGAAWVETVAFASRKDWLVSTAGRVLRLWNSNGELLTEYPAHPSTISDIAWQRDEPFFTSVAYGQLAIFRPGEPQPFKKFEWKGSILRVVWSPDSNYVATGNQDASVHFWYRKSGKDLEMSGYAAKVRELAWDTTSRYLATCGSPVITVWDCGGKGPACTRPIQLDGHNGLPTAIAYQHKGPLLASGCRNGRLCLWSPAKSEDLLFSAKLDGEITQLCWSPDDRLLAAATGDGDVAVYKVS